MKKKSDKKINMRTKKSNLTNKNTNNQEYNLQLFEYEVIKNENPKDPYIKIKFRVKEKNKQ
jgi:hypothetical protein